MIEESIELLEKSLRDLDKITEKLGLDHRFGKVSEYQVANHIFKRFHELGYNFSAIDTRGFRVSGNENAVAYFDIALENRQIIILVNVYEEICKRDIEKHRESMPIVRQHYERRNITKELIGAVACTAFPEKIKQFAIENGFYVIIPDSDTLKIDVPQNFKPRIF